MPHSIVGWKALSKYTGKSESTCRKWVNQKEHSLPFNKEGNKYVFDPAEVDAWRSTRTSFHPQGDLANAGDAQGDAAELLGEKVRLTREQANKAEFENRVRAGELLEREIYEQCVRDALTVCKSQFKELRLNIDRVCPGLPKRGLEEIEKASAVAYNALLDLELPK